MAEPPKPRDPMFLIIAGAIVALFLPFAIAFPPSLLEKLAAVAALVLAAAGISALVLRLRRRK
jgi:hypothetical protein